jgi:proline dehydrogenase
MRLIRALVVNLEEQEQKQSNIIRKLVFRLVKKHIAGSTSSGVLNVVRDLNNKGFHATVTLLNDHVDDQSKAKYNTNAYIHFIRQLSRLHLNSDVSIRLSQIGYGIDDTMLEKNLQDILNVANSSKRRIWIEQESGPDNEDIMQVYRKFRPQCSTLGAEIKPEINSDIKHLVSKKDMLKLRFMPATKQKEQGEKKDRLKLYKEYIDALMGKDVTLTVLEDDPKLINRIISSNKDYKRNLIFEIPLGYSNKKLAVLQKGKLNLSVYVPYGKDWIPYFINRLSEGRVKNIAVALLNGEKSSIDSHAKNEGAKAG